MRLFVTLLISCTVGCKSRASKPSESSAAASAAAAHGSGTAAASLADGESGTLVHYQGDRETGREMFVLARDGKGWKLAIDATDTLNRFHHEIWLDAAFRFVRATFANTQNVAPPTTAGAVLERGSNGIVAERGKLLEGNAYERFSAAPIDWYIPGLGEAAWLSVCHVDPEERAIKAGHPRVTYQLEPATDWDVDGRDLTRRVVHVKVLATSTAVIVCEGTRLVGVGQAGNIAVREGDRAMAKALAALPELRAEPAADPGGSAPTPATP